MIESITIAQIEQNASNDGRAFKAHGPRPLLRRTSVPNDLYGYDGLSDAAAAAPNAQFSAHMMNIGRHHGQSINLAK